MKATYFDDSDIPDIFLPELEDDLLWTGLDTWLSDWEGGAQ